MYSNVDIRQAIESGDLLIEPFSDEIIRPAGITLHLAPELLKPLPGKVVDVKARSLPDYKTILIDQENPYPLQSGEFILAATYQKITVGQKLGFLIEGRSTLARVGLTIVQTAMLVYPGHKNRAITLELANHGPNTILLYPKMKIARVAIIELKTPSDEIYDLQGKYSRQESTGVPIFKKELLEDF